MHLRVRSRSRLHADRDRAKHRANRNLALAPIAIARSVDRDLAFVPIAISRGIAPIAASHRTQSPLSVPSSLNLTRFDDFFFLGFVCVSVLRNEWYYIFVWQPRKCEQQVENVFSMVFSRIQPNTRKYFLKYFLKCNQTHENISFPENSISRK